MDSGIGRRHALGRMAGLALLTLLSACATASTSAPGRGRPVPAGAGTSATTSTRPGRGRAASLRALPVPADPWCPSPAAGAVVLLRAEYRKAHPAARVLPDAHRLLLVGDSTACTLLPGLLAVAPYLGLEVENAAVIGCGTVSGRIAPDYYGGVDVNRPSTTCQGKALATERRAVQAGRPDVVLWSSSWERDPLLVSSAGGKQVVAATGSALWRSTLLRRIAGRLRVLRSGGAKVVLLEQPPFVDLGKVTGVTEDDRRFEAMNALLGQVASIDAPEVRAVDLSPLVCPGGPPCTILVHGLWLRGDGDHYMATGALWVAERVLPLVLDAVAPPDRR